MQRFCFKYYFIIVQQYTQYVIVKCSPTYTYNTGEECGTYYKHYVTDPSCMRYVTRHCSQVIDCIP